MMKIAVVGTGNLGWHLCRLLEELAGKVEKPVYDTASLRSRKSKQPASYDSSFLSGEVKSKEITDVSVELVGYLNRSKIKLPSIQAPLLSGKQDLSIADVIFLCLPDDEIEAYSDQLSKNDALIVHCSGALSIDKLGANKRRGVFYMLQSFSSAGSEGISRKREELKNLPVFSEIPILIEASRKEDLQLLNSLAQSISLNIHQVDSYVRKNLHCAAVFANNFTNHCLALAEEILREQNVDPALLLPLIQQTFAKSSKGSRSEIQTGPARRADHKTINAHLNLLEENKKEVYSALTKSIKTMYGN